jgi:hypothetical protein
MDKGTHVHTLVADDLWLAGNPWIAGFVCCWDPIEESVSSHCECIAVHAGIVVSERLSTSALAGAIATNLPVRCGVCTLPPKQTPGLVIDLTGPAFQRSAGIDRIDTMIIMEIG